VVGLYSFDCSEAVPGSPSLFTSVNYGPGGSSYTRYAASWAAPGADWVIAETDGKAKLIDFAQTDVPSVKLVGKEFAAEFAKCTGCKVVSRVTFSSADIGPRLQQKAEQAILKNPDANAVHVPYDGAVVAGIGPAIVASGKSSRLAVVGGEGNPTSIKLIRGDKGQDAANAVDVDWLGWGAVDTLNRALAGEPAAPEGIGWQIVDGEHNISADGTYDVGVDFKSAYRKVWGRSE
jgi:ribose transport system substrate-binding protein